MCTHKNDSLFLQQRNVCSACVENKLKVCSFILQFIISCANFTGLTIFSLDESNDVIQKKFMECREAAFIVLAGKVALGIKDQGLSSFKTDDEDDNVYSFSKLSLLVYLTVNFASQCNFDVLYWFVMYLFWQTRVPSKVFRRSSLSFSSNSKTNIQNKFTALLHAGARQRFRLQKDHQALDWSCSWNGTTHRKTANM